MRAQGQGAVRTLGQLVRASECGPAVGSALRSNPPPGRSDCSLGPFSVLPPTSSPALTVLWVGDPATGSSRGAPEEDGPVCAMALILDGSSATLWRKDLKHQGQARGLPRGHGHHALLACYLFSSRAFSAQTLRTCRSTHKRLPGLCDCRDAVGGNQQPRGLRQVKPGHAAGRRRTSSARLLKKMPLWPCTPPIRPCSTNNFLSPSLTLPSVTKVGAARGAPSRASSLW